MRNKIKFYTGDLIYQGFTKKFILGEVYNGKKLWKFKSKNKFLNFILNLNSTIFFYDLDDIIRIIFEWCQEKKIKIEKSPFLSGDNKIIEWQIKNTIFRDCFILLQEDLKKLKESFEIDYQGKSKAILLYKILKKFYDFIGWDCFDKKSISAIALEKFKKFDKSNYEKIIEYPIYPEKFDFIKKAFFPGYYYTFKNKFESKDKPIIKIDCNSFYGAMMRDNLFPWGYLIEVKTEKEIIEHLKKGELGIVEAKAKVPKDLPMGFLPKKGKERILYPIGKIIKGFWTTPEIEKAKELGYKFEFKKGLFWTFKSYLFRRYIKHLAKIKEKSKGAKRTIAKYLLVSFYGKFAQRRELSFFKYVEKPIFGKMYLDRHLTLMEEKKYMRAPFSHPEISVFTTAYCRIFMWDFCEKIGWDKIYSIINDSLILEVDENTFQKIKKFLHQDKVGKFKIEAQLKEGIVLAHGVYALKTVDGKDIVKYQGVPEEIRSLKTFEDFKKVLT
jgi:hypothetical protein